MANRTPANSGRRRRSVPASWFYLHVHTRSTTAPGTINARAYAAICRAQLAAADGDAEHGNEKRRSRRTRQQTRRWPAAEGWPAAARRSGGGGGRVRAPGSVGGGVEWRHGKRGPRWGPSREKKKEKKTETKSVRGWTRTRKSVRIFGPFSG